ncbi:6-hydroxymethylpterin diphosphokinase MptE-like protein [Pseudogemmobacter sonorensis]|uniref:6-hydroxymethylpterin diphosphokinase MptE-like protein n=1 Tax=Pseudogemmobacter sonorensis TaxID=2989681 RepID=UPI003680BE47
MATPGRMSNLSKTATKLCRELYWKPRFRLAEKLYAATGIDLISFKKLQSLRNAHSGQRVIVMGNGPSLGQVPLDSLKGWTTFASNKIFLAFESTDWRPTYFTAEDDLVIIQNIERLREKVDPASTVLIPYICKVYRSDIYADAYFGYSFRKLIDRKQHFGTDAMRELYNGFSVVYTQIQLAMYMGAKEIALIGVDFSFKTDQEGQNNGELIGGGAVNHFLKNYRKVGERWNPPLLEKQEISFALAEQETSRLGVKVWNCTPGSKLDAFERLPLEAFMARGREA